MYVLFIAVCVRFELVCCFVVYIISESVCFGLWLCCLCVNCCLVFVVLIAYCVLFGLDLSLWVCCDLCIRLVFLLAVDLVITVLFLVFLFVGDVSDWLLGSMFVRCLVLLIICLVFRLFVAWFAYLFGLVF